MVPRAFASLAVGVAVMASAPSASAAFFKATDLGGNVFQISLEGQPGDPSGFLAYVDLNGVQATSQILSFDLSVSAFFGKAVLGANGAFVDPMTVNLGGLDIFEPSIPFGPTASVPLGNLHLEGPSIAIQLGGSGLYDAGVHVAEPNTTVPVPIWQSAGSPLNFDEPATFALLALGIGAFALARRASSGSPARR